MIRVPLRGDRTNTLFPDDYVGLYDRGRFLDLGGYDREIGSAFWQLMDFGFRIYLWGYSIPVLPGFRMGYRTLPDPVDETVKPGYARFYAKNLVGRMTERGYSIPGFRAFPFAVRSRLGLVRTMRIFSAVRPWLESRRDRFIQDARMMIHEWSVGNE